MDSSSNRYFFIENPVEIIINNVTMPFKVKLLYHPDYPTKGYRTINIIPVNEVIKLYVSSSDVKSFRANQIVRLMELFNIKIKKVSDNLIAEYYNESLEDARKLKAPIIQWVKQTDNIKTQIVMPDASASIGLSEFSLINEGIGAKVQFIRFGFARMDEKSSNGVKLYFAHS